MHRLEARACRAREEGAMSLAVLPPLAPLPRGIIFSAPMILALLARKKRVTRRLSRQWLKLEVDQLLWAKETFCWLTGNGIRPWYRADGETPIGLNGEPVRGTPIWNPSIFMPWDVHRITMRVAEPPRLEPVQAITEEDALLEGITAVSFYPDDGFPLSIGYMFGADDGKTPLHPTARGAFESGWKTLHTKPGKRWEDDPEVVRIAFEVVEVKK
jgi:hypothetical protein